MEWKSIPETGGRYEASDTGQIRNVPTPIVVIRGGIPYNRMTTGKVLRQHHIAQHNSKTAYAYVYIRRNGKSERRAVHALVLDAFVGPRAPDQQCRHLNGHSLDNRIENLRWGTAAENRADIRRHGRTAYGERNGQTTLSVEDVLALRVMSARGMSYYQLSEWFGVSATTASDIAKGLSWPKVIAALEAAPKERG